MVLWGTLVNAAAILLGSFIGWLLPLPEGIRRTVLQGMGLSVAVIGVSMALDTANMLIVIGSMAVGGVIGDWLRIEDRLNRIGSILQAALPGGQHHSRTSQGFLTASLVYCVGAMAVLGSFESGLTLQHDILYAKSMLDGVSSIFFTASFGLGTALSAVPVFFYQGTLALAAQSIEPLLSDSVIQEITAVGGLLIVGIGINILGMAQIKVGNLLPALLIAAAIALILG